MGNTTQSATTLNIESATPQGRISANAALRHDRLFWLTAALLVILLAFILFFPLRAAGDIALYVDIGGRVLDGQRPYIDFFDINPPTIHFLNILPVAFSRLTGIHPILVFHLFIWLMVAGTSLGIGHILSRAHREDRLGNLPPWLIPVLLVLGSYVTWLLIAFGQRDHIFIVALPAWAILRWYRWEGGRPGDWIAVLIGVLGAVGASLKPTFILGFGLVEAYGLLRYRRWRAYFTWEMLGVGLIIGLYGLYFVTQPEVLHVYLTEVTPSVVENYSSYGCMSAPHLIFGEYQSMIALSLAALVAFLGLRQGAALGRLLVLAAILGLAGLLSYALQTKGWRYHSLPMLSMIFLTGGLLVDRVFARPGLRVILRRRRLAGAVPTTIALLCIVCGVFVATKVTYGEASAIELTTYTQYAQPGDPVIVADIDVMPFYPTVIQAGRRPIGRYPMAYPLAFAFAGVDELPADAYDASVAPPPLAQAFLDVFMQDIRLQQPQLILLRTNAYTICKASIETARYVKAHTDIGSVLAQDYDSLGVLYPFEVYVRRGS